MFDADASPFQSSNLGVLEVEVSTSSELLFPSVPQLLPREAETALVVPVIDAGLRGDKGRQMPGQLSTFKLTKLSRLNKSPGDS